MATLYGWQAQSIIKDLAIAKQRIAEGHTTSAQEWIDSAMQTLMRTVIQDVEAETIPAPTEDAA